jgi:ABC transporter substrate binding protein (PQQ-dependent alcohol dehydrogenase system)
MIEAGMRNLAIVVLAAVAMSLAAPTSRAAELTTVTVGYLEITDDPRYEEKRAYARIRVKPHDRPLPGAEMAIRESRILGRVLKMKFRLEWATGKTAAALASEVERMSADGVRYFLVDANASVLGALATATKGRNLFLFNISEPSDALRAGGCRAQLMHTLPSYAMMTDALAQVLIANKWRQVLVLKGPLADDAAFAQAFQVSAKRFGVRVTATRDFVLGNDPRERGKNNIRLMTAEDDYDVVFVADTEGAFGRYVPYQTNRPRPVIGTEGLIAEAWHWSWEHHGAPQLNQRFEKRAKRRMTGPDWAAWVAVKAIVESIVRTKSADFKTVRAYLQGDRMTLDGYKGTPSSFRPWDNQLRQPILLRTHNAVIQRAPLKGFLHPTENMDTLGFDRADKKCRLE